MIGKSCSHNDIVAITSIIKFKIVLGMDACSLSFPFYTRISSQTFFKALTTNIIHDMTMFWFQDFFQNESVIQTIQQTSSSGSICYGLGKL